MCDIQCHTTLSRNISTVIIEYLCTNGAYIYGQSGMYKGVFFCVFTKKTFGGTFEILKKKNEEKNENSSALTTKIPSARPRSLTDSVFPVPAGPAGAPPKYMPRACASVMYALLYTSVESGMHGKVDEFRLELLARYLRRVWADI